MDLLILNQYFPPDQAATGMLLGQLSDQLGRSLDVTVVCGTPTYNPGAPRPAVESTAHRVPLFSISRTWMIFRLFNYLIFSIGALLKALLLPRHDVIMCWTDPPWISGIGAIVKAIKGSTLVLVHQDIYPEILVATGKMNRGKVFSFLQRASALMLANADHHVVIGKEMVPILATKKIPTHRITVIENWQDVSAIRPTDGHTFRDGHQIGRDTFVVMHSGNMGFSQNLDLLLDAAERLQEEPILFLLIGDGARKRHLSEKAEKLGLANIRFLPYQPDNQLSESLCAADVHYVSLLESFAGVIVPSKTYGIMAAGRATVAVLPKNCTTKDVIEKSDSGVFASNDVMDLATVLLELSRNRSKVEHMGKNARTYAERSGGKENAANKYASLLKNVLQIQR